MDSGLIEKWIKTGYDAGTLNHRLYFLDIISKYFPFNSVLDVCSADGADLSLIGLQYPGVSLTGVDHAIGEPKMQIEGKLYSGVVPEYLGTFPDKTFDITISNGGLMYISKDLLPLTAREMIRITKKAIILSEVDPYSESSPRGYEAIFPRAVKTKLPPHLRISPWVKDGYIYEIVL